MRRSAVLWSAVMGLVGWLGAADAQATAMLDVQGGLLVGATGVDVGGTLYGVEFVDGSCITVFNGCQDGVIFTFTTLADAAAASKALLDQVFVGIYDTNPALTAGCGAPDFCFVYTPYGKTLAKKIALSAAWNFVDDASDAIQDAEVAGSADFSVYTADVYARWTPSGQANPIPEPSAALVFAVGLALVSRRTRRVARPGAS